MHFLSASKKKSSIQIKIFDYCSEDSVSIWTNGLLYINISLISWTYKVIVFKSLFPSYILVLWPILPACHTNTIVNWFLQLTAVATTSPSDYKALYFSSSSLLSDPLTYFLSYTKCW